MAYDGNGVFNRLYNWEADAAAGINILAERFDAEMNGMAVGLSTALTRDGQAGMLANLDMGGFRITGVGDATADNDAISRAAGDARYLRLDGTGVMVGPIKLKDTAASIQWLNPAGIPRFAMARDDSNGRLNVVRLDAAGVIQGPVVSFEQDGVSTFHSNVRINLVGGGAGLILQNGNGVDRWAFARDTGTGDLLIARFGTDGVFQNSPIRLRQSDGAVLLTTNLDSPAAAAFTNGVIFGRRTDQTIREVRDVIFGSGNNMAVTQLLDVGGNALVEQRIALSGDIAMVSYVRANINRTDIVMQPGTGFFMNMGNQTGSANIVGVWNGVNMHRVSVSSSERRMKRDFKTIENGLAAVLAMKPITFRPKDTGEPDRVWPGFVVEDMEEIGLPELIIDNGPDNPRGLAYDRVPVYLVAAIKELHRRIEQLEGVA